MKCSLDISDFLEEISSLSHSISFLCFFALITEEGTLSYLSLLFFGTLYSSEYIFIFGFPIFIIVLLLNRLLCSLILHVENVPHMVWKTAFFTLA